MFKRFAPAILFSVLLVACGTLQEAKPYANTTDDVARYLCGVFHSKKAGISLQEAIDTSCDTMEKIRPFYKPIIALERAGLSGVDPDAEPTGCTQQRIPVIVTFDSYEATPPDAGAADATGD